MGKIYTLLNPSLSFIENIQVYRLLNTPQSKFGSKKSKVSDK